MWVCVICLKVDLKFELEEKDLLLLSDGDGRASFDRLDLVEFRPHTLFLTLDRNVDEVVKEVLFGELCVVALLPVPGVFVPD